MGQKAITIYTPAATPPHINAEDDAQVYRAVFGQVSGIAASDSQLACSIIDNNTVRMQSGTFSNQGYIICVPGGQTVDFSVQSGTQNMFRIDSIVATFIRGGGNTPDSHTFSVVTGTAAATQTAAQPPTLTQNDLSTGGSMRQEALFNLLIAGTTLQSVTRVANMVGSFYQ